MPQGLAKGRILSSEQQIVQGRFIQGEARVKPISLGGEEERPCWVLALLLAWARESSMPSCLSISLATPTTLEQSFLLFLYGFYIHRVRGLLRRPREAVGMFSLDYQKGHLS